MTGLVQALLASLTRRPLLSQHAQGDPLWYVRWVDLRAAEFVTSIRTPPLTEAMTSMTGLGSVTAGVVLVGLFHLAGWREEFRTSVVALSILGIVVWGLMSVVERPFPSNPVCVTEGSSGTTSSFPSGHAAAVTAYAMVARTSEELLFAATTALAALIAFSRIYLGTHYLSDTVVGIGLGMVSVVIAEQILDRTDIDALLDRLPFGSDR
ncbi:phosphatase PAP2 family protein [Halorubrum laminariae]|uniref:Phosphatase PAP2 family protein n=1 Tax=Halorubrum laminariae TaxID=1433523 RepID=A0ABD6C4R5_9EURY|nr:phosphatase PAP2 family protein [Halorubrum laminariae]